MVRLGCCEKVVGMKKKGPWSPGEDEILVSYIRRHGHTNWRALPKSAGLLRCGKSCRLRWTNYLRPDIKRGNFTPEEDQAIIHYHRILGNRWSAIAAKLPGRTDNEIKNVWNTRLKKTLVRKQSMDSPSSDSYTGVTTSDEDDVDDGAAEEMIEESFWTETLFMNTACENAPSMDSSAAATPECFPPADSDNVVVEGGMSFWYRVLMQAGDLQGLPAI